MMDPRPSDSETGSVGRELGYVILRVILGLNMFMHGVVRIFGDYAGFVDGLEKAFSGTLLPILLVRGFAWVLPWVEAAIGLSLILGLYTLAGLTAGAVLMGVLVFGMSLLQKWDTVAFQMLYVLIYYLLLRDYSPHPWSLDQWRRRANRKGE